ncbi:MAG: class I SAM-dependent methyltransferase [Firmicutes bacterium]|nr:class I SAM-dependent methyltransferase [Bacillota bacterium]
MAEHYFTSKPSSEHKVTQFTAVLRGKEYVFKTDAGVFSRGEIDRGTRLLIEALPCKEGDVVLDLGCGYGPIGAAAGDLVKPSGHVYLVDINERAVELAAVNLKMNQVTNGTVLVSDGLQSLPANIQFDWVVTNPPIRAGKSIVYGLLTEAYHFIKPGGGLMVVIRTKQGAKSMERYLTDLFGNCETVDRGSGFRVFSCCKHLPS